MRTVFWSRFSKTRNKQFQSNFSLPKEVKTFRVAVIAVNDQGQYGQYTSYIKVQRAFNTILEQPLFVRKDEQVECRLLLENNRNVEIQVEVPLLKRTVTIPAKQSYVVKVKVTPAQLPLSIDAISKFDSSRRSHRIDMPVYEGITFERSQNLEVIISKEETVTGNCALIELPADVVVDSVRARVDYKQVGVNMLLTGLGKLVTEPCGCFEQTSATTFPIVMVLQYLENLKEKSQEMMKLKLDAEEKMKRGIKRLLGYECKKGGFEWFGSDPGHVTLTAYGVWQFIEMNQLGDHIDPDIIDRTLDWLRKAYNCKDSEFKISASGCDDFGNPPQFCSDIYIVFILTMLDDYDVKYRQIVEEKLSKIEEGSGENLKDVYLASFVSMIYLGKPII